MPKSYFMWDNLNDKSGIYSELYIVHLHVDLHVALMRPQCSTVSILHSIYKYGMLNITLCFIQYIVTDLRMIAVTNLDIESNKCRLSGIISKLDVFK